MTWTDADRKRETWLQREGERLVEREVVCCVSGLVSDLADMEWEQDDTMELLSPTCGECEGRGYFSACEDCDGNGDNGGEVNGSPEGECYTCDGKGKIASDSGADDPCDECGGEGHFEAFEHWVVSSWLGGKLREAGETVVEDWHGLEVWARCTTGQSISQDGVIREVVSAVWASELAEVEAGGETREEKESRESARMAQLGREAVRIMRSTCGEKITEPQTLADGLARDGFQELVGFALERGMLS